MAATPENPDALSTALSVPVSRRAIVPALFAFGGLVAAACSGESDPATEITTFGETTPSLEIIRGVDLGTERSMTINEDFREVFTQVHREVLGNQLGLVRISKWSGELLDIHFGTNQLLRLHPIRVSPVEGFITIATIKDEIGRLSEEREAYLANYHPSPSEPPEPEESVEWTEHPDWYQRGHEPLSVEEWVTYKGEILAIVENQKDLKKATKEVFAESNTEDWQEACKEFIREYDRMFHKTNESPFGWGASESKFTDQSSYLHAHVRDDEGKRLIMQNFYFSRNPDLVGVNNPTSKTIWFDNGEVKGTILIEHGSDDVRWYEHDNHPIWTPLSIEEMKHIASSMQEIFDTAKLKREL